VKHKELRRVVYGAMQEHATTLFAEETFFKRALRKMREALNPGDEGFIPPMNEIRDAMGDRFDDLRECLIEKSEQIY
jgi:hypothetical protein